MNRIEGNTAIVTGTGRGIGLAIVKTLLEAGVSVCATSRNTSSLKSLEGERLIAVSADLTDMGAFQTIVDKCTERFGGVDYVVNNAGLGMKRLLTETSAEEWDLHFAVNVRAPFMLNNAAMPHLLKSGCPTIFNICSAVAVQGYETQGAYSAAKHALLGYTKVLAKETFEQGIRVHAISPGGVATELIQETRPDLDLDILSKPEEIADIILFLLQNRGNTVMDHIQVHRYSKKPWA